MRVSSREPARIAHTPAGGVEKAGHLGIVPEGRGHALAARSAPGSWSTDVAQNERSEFCNLNERSEFRR